MTTTDPASLPREWARLHPLSPLLRFLRALAALAVVLAPNQIAHRRQSPWWDLVAIAIALLAGVVSWLVTRWRIHAGELQIETGLIRRQSLRVPLTRLQAVDVVRPLAARVLGLAEVRLVVAGQGSGRTRLAYLTEARAEAVRGQLLALAHGLTPDTPTPPERPLFRVPGGRIIGANLLSGVFLALVIGLLASAIALALAGAGAGSIGIVPLLVFLPLGLLRRIGTEWDFAVAEAPDGLRLKAGLLQTRAETIPYGRVQALRWVQPLWWRPLGWVRVEIDVARRHDHDRTEQESASATRALLPVGEAPAAAWLMSRVYPNAPLVPPAGVRAPRRAIWRAPMQWHNLDAWHDEQFMICAEGRFVRRITVVPLAKAQSIRWTQGPLLRRLRLASVHVDTAGRRFPGAALCRDEEQARQWVRALPDLARAARATPAP